jgi:hypothetical protein
VARIADPVAERFERIFTPKHCTDSFQSVARELGEFSAACAARKHRDSRIELVDADAANLMDELIFAWAEHINADSPWSPAKALYLQRRFPIENCWSSMSDPSLPEDFVHMATAGTERLLTVLNGSLRSDEEPYISDTSGGARFEVTGEEAVGFSRRVARTQHLWLLQNTARIVGKGGALSFKSGEVPNAVQSDEVSRAAALFDSRQPRMGEIGVVGTTVWERRTSLNSTTIGWWYYAPAAPPVSASTALRAQVDAGVYSKRRVQHAVRFAMEMRDFRPYIELVGLDDSSASRDPEVSALLVLLYALLRTDETALQWGLNRVGYVRVARDVLFSQVGDAIRNAHPGLSGVPVTGPSDIATLTTRIIARLMRLPGEVWPTVEGPMIHRTADGGLIVDAFAACNRLRSRLVIGRQGGGAAANVRGLSFEDVVQKVVDTAGFGPPSDSPLRELRGRTLSRARKAITDVDAILMLAEDQCLFVQAKSYPYSPAYGAGRYSDVRNLRTKVSEEARDWRDKVSKLLSPSIPGEDQNFTIPAGTKIAPLFVLPFAPYLPIEIATQMAAPGLAYICSLGELEAFLAELREERVSSE